MKEGVICGLGAKYFFSSPGCAFYFGEQILSDIFWFYWKMETNLQVDCFMSENSRLWFEWVLRLVVKTFQ